MPTSRALERVELTWHLSSNIRYEHKSQRLPGIVMLMLDQVIICSSLCF